MSRRVVLMLLSFLLAVGGAFLVFVYVKGADARAVAGTQPAEVYVATATVPSGTTLKDALRKDLVERTQVPARTVPTGALRAVNAGNDQLLALSDVQAGELLLAARFGETPTGNKAIEVPPGQVAVSVELTDPGRVGKFVTPGSHIAIYSNAKLVSLSDSDRAKRINELEFHETSVLLPDVQVIGMGDTPLSAPQAAPTEDADPTVQQQPSFLVTVAVTPAQAVKLVHYSMNGELYSALRGSDVSIDASDEYNDLTQGRSQVR